MPRGFSKSSLPASLQSRTPRTCQCASISATPAWIQCSYRGIAISSIRQDEYDAAPEPPPRWRTTPAAMTAPVRVRPLPVRSHEFTVNTSSELLDEVYVNMLGKEGDKVLTEEVKWLAVTHKSFDHGRRGYNDRLAFLGTANKKWSSPNADRESCTGKRIVELQTSLAILTAGASSDPPPPKKDSYGRLPYQNPALEGIEQLTDKSRSAVLDPNRMGGLADRYGLNRVIRWKPKNVRLADISWRG